MAQEQNWRDWLDRLSREGRLPQADQTVESIRRAFLAGMNVLEGPAPELVEVRDLTFPGAAGPLAARLYVPLGAGVPPGPGLIYYHGGGFVMGDLDTFDRCCRRLAASSHVRVLSATYRLAPEHKFPAAVEDALAAFDWAAGEGAEEIGFDPDRIAVGGDSAGGNLSAVIGQLRRKPGPAPAAQSAADSKRGAEPGSAPAFMLSIYPLMQLVETNQERQKVLEGHMMSTAILDAVKKNYLGPDDDPADPRASPLFAKDHAGTPPTYMVTCGLDPLQHEAKAYADMLAAAGVPVERAHYPTMPHGFFQMTAVTDAAGEAIDAAGKALAKGLARKEAKAAG
ncbi:MAG: alpha/beta hydrolase [Maricaulaceae bacterium]|jgi:acetyl esterase